MSAPTSATRNNSNQFKGTPGRCAPPWVTLAESDLATNKQPQKFPTRQAITLIEVVVGLVLLSTLLTVILISTGKLHRQQKAAIQKLEAVQILDELAGDFFRDGFPNLDTTGQIESQPNIIWKQTGQPSPIAPDRLVNVRLSILQSPINESIPQLATLEILVQRDQIGRYKQ